MSNRLIDQSQSFCFQPLTDVKFMRFKVAQKHPERRDEPKVFRPYQYRLCL
jgi:hypothetical protein